MFTWKQLIIKWLSSLFFGGMQYISLYEYQFWFKMTIQEFFYDTRTNHRITSTQISSRFEKFIWVNKYILYTILYAIILSWALSKNTIMITYQWSCLKNNFKVVGSCDQKTLRFFFWSILKKFTPIANQNSKHFFGSICLLWCHGVINLTFLHWLCKLHINCFSLHIFFNWINHGINYKLILFKMNKIFKNIKHCNFFI